VTDQFSPDKWLTSAFGALTDYIKGEIDEYVQDGSGNNGVGLQAYELVMDYPPSSELPMPGEFKKTIIHLALDDVENRRLGLGPQFVQSDESPGAAGAVQISPIEAYMHMLSFDVGIWASDLSGGTTSRLIAYEMLDRILNGDIARVKCFEATGGVEIISYTSGRFVPDAINDIRIFRVVGAELMVRVYSRKVVTDAAIIVDEITQDPNLEIDLVPLPE
jgi:hypothetical protein